MSLEPCPSSPNCVSSAADPGDGVHYMAPIGYTSDAAATISVIESEIVAIGGTVTATTADRVDATFRTPLLRFTDDVTFQLDDEAKLLNFRSASRVGHSDLGANRKRLTALVPKIASQIS